LVKKLVALAITFEPEMVESQSKAEKTRIPAYFPIKI